MKKSLLAAPVTAPLALPLMSPRVVATLGIVLGYDTGAKVRGTSVDNARIHWDIESCRWIAEYNQVTIDYGGTTPRSARPEGFENYQPPTVGRDFEPYPNQEGVDYWEVIGVWHGYVEFGSHVDAIKGTNHGDIRIHYPDSPPDCISTSSCTPIYGFLVYWSLQIQHGA